MAVKHGIDSHDIGRLTRGPTLAWQGTASVKLTRKAATTKMPVGWTSMSDYILLLSSLYMPSDLLQFIAGRSTILRGYVKNFACIN